MEMNSLIVERWLLANSSSATARFARREFFGRKAAGLGRAPNAEETMGPAACEARESPRTGVIARRGAAGKARGKRCSSIESESFPAPQRQLKAVACPQGPSARPGGAGGIQVNPRP